MLISVTALGKGVRIKYIDFYGDLTMHALITDESGQGITICIDGRKNSPTRYRLFERGRHPKKPGAVLVELGSPEEGIVIPLLSSYLNAHGPKGSGLGEYGWELARETLIHYGEPAV